jgi:hypothetical protein
LSFHQIDRKDERTIKHCSNCQVRIRGNKERCPLCRNILPVEKDIDKFREVYPDIPPFYERHIAIRIMAFISVVAIVAGFVIHNIFPSRVNWPMFELFGIISMWIGLIVVLRKRHNIPKNIMWLVLIVSLLSIFWDWRTGSRGWSLDYVIPIVSVSAMFVMYVTAKIMNLSVNDYIAYFLLDALFGIIPIIFILMGWINIIIPSVICVAVSIIFLSAILIFQGENIKAELSKRMHV